MMSMAILHVLPFHVFADAPGSCSSGFLLIPHWYQYIPAADFTNCQLNNKFLTPGGSLESLLYVGLGVINILLYLAGLIAAAYVIYGGIQYITSQGEPDRTKAAKNTIINALIGVVIATIAIGLVAFIGNSLG
jgi:ABC-type Fe3+ transport system permease subunit